MKNSNQAKHTLTLLFHFRELKINVMVSVQSNKNSFYLNDQHDTDDNGSQLLKEKNGFKCRNQKGKKRTNYVLKITTITRWRGDVKKNYNFRVLFVFWLLSNFFDCDLADSMENSEKKCEKTKIGLEGKYIYFMEKIPKRVRVFYSKKKRKIKIKIAYRLG